MLMATIEESIKEVEAEIAKTQVNKHTEYHIGKLKAKIARLKDEQEKRRSTGGGGGKGYSVKKSGNATVALVGFPSVGKSTLLNRLTGAESEVGAYDFTTIDVVPGIMEYNSAKIQILDLPGLIRDASKGKGRGREVLSVVRSAGPDPIRSGYLRYKPSGSDRRAGDGRDTHKHTSGGRGRHQD